MPLGRALYLESGLPWQISLDDGVALRIELPGRARSLVPLQRLSRVQSGIQVRWTTDALLACLRAGIPVVFSDARGTVHGWCFGPRRRESTLAQRLRHAVREPDWPQFWHAWKQQTSLREGRRLQHVLKLPVCDGIDACDLARQHVQACNRLCWLWGTAPGPWLRAGQRALRCLVAEVCADMIGDPELLDHPCPGLHLPEELAGLLIGRLDALLARCSRSRIAQQPPAQMVAELLETRGADLDRGCAELLGDLDHCLREWQP
jgi:hypothetical protein